MLLYFTNLRDLLCLELLFVFVAVCMLALFGNMLRRVRLCRFWRRSFLLLWYLSRRQSPAQFKSGGSILHFRHSRLSQQHAMLPEVETEKENTHLLPFAVVSNSIISENAALARSSSRK